MKLEKAILNYLENNYPVSFDRLAEFFQATSTDKFRDLMKAVNSLQERYLIIQDEKERFLPFLKSPYKIGKLSIASRGYGFVDLPAASYFIPSNALYGAMDADEVLIKLGDDGTAEVCQVIKRAHHSLVLETGLAHGKIVFSSINRLIDADICVINTREFKLKPGQYVEAEIVAYYPQLKVKIRQVVGSKDAPGNDITAILLDYQLPVEFPLAVMAEEKELATKVELSDLKGRVDHRTLATVTIDGDDAKDFDDALSIEKAGNNYRLYVHIADVAHYVKAGSAIDQEAYRRTSSIYVVDRVVPMLPFSLSNGLCSLQAGELRLTVTCELLLTKSGIVKESKIYPSYIISKDRLTYEKVNQLLAGDQDIPAGYQKWQELLVLMKDCAAAIRQRREKAGCLDFMKSETVFKVDEKGQVLELSARLTGVAEKMVEDFMIAANEAVATIFRQRRIPTIYRVHDKPPVKKINEFMLFIKNLGLIGTISKKETDAQQLQEILKKASTSVYCQAINTLLLRSMSKAVYSCKCQGHFGLALTSYLHFSAPIRRYGDLIVQRQLHRHYFSEENVVANQEAETLKMKERAEYLSLVERKIMAAEYEIADMKKAEYMIKYRNQQVSGIITTINEYGFYVELANTVEGFIHVASLNGYYQLDSRRQRWINYSNGKSYQLGQKVNCLVVNANKERRSIDFELIELIGKENRKHGKDNRR